jgi:hypothetical protein
MWGLYLYNSIRELRNRRNQERVAVAEMMSDHLFDQTRIQDSNPGERKSGETGISTGEPVRVTGTAGVPGVQSVGSVVRVRMSPRSASPKAKPKTGDRYDLLKKEKEPEKDPKASAKGRSRYDLLKNKE